MRISSTLGVRVGWLVGRWNSADLCASFIIKVTLRMNFGGVPSLEEEPENICGDLHLGSDLGEELSYPSDFVPLKLRTDILLVGTGYAPGGLAVPFFPVRLRVGNRVKCVEVVGDRVWDRGSLGARPGSAQPIVKLPIRYENAWGAPDYERNPVGRGRKTDQMHNLELPNSWVDGPGSANDPAGFGPIPASWEPRKSKVGAYKGYWVKERWPWFPTDFDWSYFNAAPADQQAEGHLRGDEELEFENLHPEHSIYKSRLPGLQARCFLNERLQDGERLFREVHMNLDTIWINVEEEKLILVWRGIADVRTLKLREIEQVLAVTEPLSESPRSLEDHWADVERQLNEGNEVELLDADTHAADAALEKELADMDKEFAEADREMAKAEAEANKSFEEQKSQAIADGMNPKLFEERAIPKTLAEVKAEYQAGMAELKRADPEHAASAEEIDFSEFEQMEAEGAQMEAEMAADAPSSPTRESVQAGLVGGGRGLAGQDLSGLDLAGLDLSRADFSGVSLSNADLRRAKLVGADLRQADLRNADLTEADLTGAILDEADFTMATLDKAKMAGVSVAGTTFSELELTGADFSGAKGKGADFSKANLARACFIGARLPQSDFSKANLEKADFSSTEVQAAQFDGAMAKGIQMAGSDISGLHGGDKADFEGGNFTCAKGAGSVWEQSNLDGADFSKALLSRANFNEASLRGARFDRADAMKASFEDACMQNAVLTNANLLRATFNRADLTRADLSRSNLYESGFWETVFEETVVEGANLRGTLLT